VSSSGSLLFPLHFCTSCHVSLAHSFLFSHFSFFRYRGTPVPTTLGFCLTLLPILSMGFPSMEREETYFIRTISESELSTPEDYLKSLEENAPDDLANTDSSSRDEDDLEAQPPTNEGTPLLS